MELSIVNHRQASLVPALKKQVRLNASDSWPKLDAEFRELSNSAGDLHANAFGPSWHLLGGPSDDYARKRLHDRFDSLARLGGVRAGVPNRSNARDGWLTLVREECPHSTLFKGRMIQSVCLASAEACQKIERREIEFQRIADSNGPYGLRRDMYQPSGWLYDHDHEPLRELDAELDYWKKHIWDSFHERIDGIKAISEKRQQRGDPPWGDRGEELETAVIKLSYDLAVLQANHTLDLGLRAYDAVKAFDNGRAPLAETMESQWLTNRAALDLPIPADDDSLDVAAPFRRVYDHFRQLLHRLAGGKSGEGAGASGPEGRRSPSPAFDFGETAGSARTGSLETNELAHRPPLKAVAEDEERRESARENLVRALQSYMNKLGNLRDRSAHRETEIFCDYARENYNSRAAPYFEAMPSLDPRVLFEVGDMAQRRDLTGLPTIGDVFERVKDVTVRRPDHLPDPAGVYLGGLSFGDTESFKWLLLAPWDQWFRQQIRDCVNECVRNKREKYELLVAASSTALTPDSSESKSERSSGGNRQPSFPNRATWLETRLRERSWNKHDLWRQGGPDHKTVQKILNGSGVREDVLEKLAAALSNKNAKVTVLDIPQG